MRCVDVRICPLSALHASHHTKTHPKFRMCSIRSPSSKAAVLAFIAYIITHSMYYELSDLKWNTLRVPNRIWYFAKQVSWSDQNVRTRIPHCGCVNVRVLCLENYPGLIWWFRFFAHLELGASNSPGSQKAYILQKHMTFLSVRIISGGTFTPV